MFFSLRSRLVAIYLSTYLDAKLISALAVQATDLNYINDLVSDLPNANKLSKIAKSFYKQASKKGFGNLLVSELIDKEKY